MESLSSLNTRSRLWHDLSVPITIEDEDGNVRKVEYSFCSNQELRLKFLPYIPEIGDRFRWRIPSNKNNEWTRDIATVISVDDEGFRARYDIGVIGFFKTAPQYWEFKKVE